MSLFPQPVMPPPGRRYKGDRRDQDADSPPVAPLGCVAAFINERPGSFLNVLGPLREPALSPGQRGAREQSSFLVTIRFFLPGVPSPLTRATPCQKLALGSDRFAAALNDEILIGLQNVGVTLSKPALRLLQREAQEQRIDLVPIRRFLPGAASRFDAIAPAQKLALGGDPFLELVPAAENRLVRDLGVGLARLGRDGDEKSVGIAGKLGDKSPFVVRELVAGRSAPRRLAVLAHGRELEREDAPERILGARTLGEKLVGALDKYPAELEGFRRKP